MCFGRGLLSLPLYLFPVLVFFSSSFSIAELPRMDKHEWAIAALEAQRTEADNSANMSIFSLRQQIDSLRSTLTGKTDAFTRSNVSNSISDLSRQINELSRARSESSNNFSRQINEARRRASWTSRGNTVSSNGQPIPTWVSRFRQGDGGLEFDPKMDPASLPTYIAANERQFLARADELGQEYSKQAAAFKKIWLDDWMVETEKAQVAWYENQLDILKQEPEAVLRQNAQIPLDALNKRIGDFLKAKRAEFEQEHQRMLKRASEEVKDYLITSLRAGDSLSNAESEVRLALNHVGRSRLDVENRFHAEWTGGRSGNGGLLKDWKDWAGLGILKQHMETERQAFRPYAARKTELLKRWSTLEDQFAKASDPLLSEITSRFSEWEKRSRATLAAEPHRHIALHVSAQFDKELAIRNKFSSDVTEVFAALKRKRREQLDKQLERISDAYAAKIAVDSVWPEVERTFETRSAPWPSELASEIEKRRQEFTQEQNREGLLPSIEKQVAEETARYPLSIVPDGCSYEYHVELKDEYTTLNFRSEKNRVPLRQIMGKRSFACDGKLAVIVADRLKSLGKTNGQDDAASTPPSQGEAILYVGEKEQAKLSLPAEGLSFRKVHHANSTFYVSFSDPEGNLVEEFCLAIYPPQEGADQAKTRVEPLPAFPEKKEIWSRE